MTLVGASSGNAKVRVKRVRTGPFGGPTQTAKEVSSTLYNVVLSTVPGAIPIAYVPDALAVTPANFTSMADKVTIGTGTNTLMTLGVWRTVSQTAATAADPYQRTFLAIKCDHQGFNACNVEMWNEKCLQFQYVKQSPYAVIITLPEPPMQAKTAGPVSMTRPGAMTAAQLLGYQQVMISTGFVAAPAIATNANIWPETRSIGAWEYIIVPPQVAASINLTEIGDLAAWQRLLNLGFQSKKCTRKRYMISCGTTGFNGDGGANLRLKLQAVSPAGVIPAANSTNFSASVEGIHNQRHQVQECDWCCQFNAPASLAIPASYATAQTYSLNLVAQGFDTIPFGSGIVFQFIQYAPPTTDTAANTACPVNMPYTIEVCSKTEWSQLRNGARDLGQLSTLPLIGP